MNDVLSTASINISLIESRFVYFSFQQPGPLYSEDKSTTISL
jgi:hypothetical protein